MCDEKCGMVWCGHIYFGASSLITDQFLTSSLLSHHMGNVLTYFIHSWAEQPDISRIKCLLVFPVWGALLPFQVSWTVCSTSLV